MTRLSTLLTRMSRNSREHLWHPSLRLYRMTLSTGSLYDKADREAQKLRRALQSLTTWRCAPKPEASRSFAVPIFLKRVRRELGVRVSPGRVRIGVEREQTALSAIRNVNAEFLVISYHGKQHVAKRLQTETFSLVRSKRPKPSKRRLRKRVRVKRKNRRKAKTEQVEQRSIAPDERREHRLPEAASWIRLQR